MRMNDFKNKLLNVINQSGLTIEEVYYIWKDLFEELTISYNNLLIKEQQEKDKKENNENTEKANEQNEE